MPVASTDPCAIAFLTAGFHPGIAPSAPESFALRADGIDWSRIWSSIDPFITTYVRPL